MTVKSLKKFFFKIFSVIEEINRYPWICGHEAIGFTFMFGQVA